MPRIHPAATMLGAEDPSVIDPSVSDHRRVWTVWKKSSMAFQGTDGFSVYDDEGTLAFRVENYSRRNKYLFEELILMDGAGKPVLSLWPQMLSMRDRWNGTRTSVTGIDSHVFSVKRRWILQQVDVDEAEVFLGKSVTPNFVIRGCFWKRSCKILHSSGEVAAEISRKKRINSVQLGDDVFNLIIKPGVDCQLMVALVVIMDRISYKSYSPLMCSS